jgi:creatinine amidohydrolase
MEIDMQLENLKYPEVRKYLKSKKSIIIPFGSTEQHGPHLPIGTDTIIAKSIANEVGNRTKTIVGPVLPVGFSPGLHTKFPGTISIGSKTYIALVLEILKGITNSGFRDLMIVSGHGMNMHPLRTAIMEFLDNNDARALIMGYWESEEMSMLCEEGDGVHCTILETSMILYLHPELVDMKKGINEYRKSRFMLGENEIKQLSKTGIIAETMKSTKEKGKLAYEAAIEGISRRVLMFEEDNLFE